MAPVSIVHFLDTSPNKRGPVELQLAEMARQLKLSGGQMRCYFTGPAAPWFAQLLADNGGQLGYLSTANWHRDAEGICRQASADVAHFHFGPLRPPRGLRPLGVRIVRTEHSFRPQRSSAALRRVVRALRTLQVDHFVAVSEFIAAQTRRDLLARPARVSVIYNGTDLERFRPSSVAERQALRRDLLGISDERPVATIAAHLSAEKRHLLLLDAWRKVTHRYQEAHLVIAGNGKERPRISAAIERLGLNPRVSLLTGENDVADLYGASDLAVLPSAGEGLPGSGIEALACGVPLVVTPNGGLSEVVGGEACGMVVNSETAGGLAGAIIELIEDPTLRLDLARNGRARAERLFDVRRSAANTLELYWKLANGRRSAEPGMD